MRRLLLACVPLTIAAVIACAGTAQAAMKSCGNTTVQPIMAVWASSNTTCQFAKATANAYNRHPNRKVYKVWSKALKKRITMRCKGVAGDGVNTYDHVECKGGKKAQVNITP